uniref:Immunoglobulin-like domain containing receptor 1a n=1 Tax=Lepisosteus oculatus TaxID=7918 RepID=W5MTU1_LEPOC
LWSVIFLRLLILFLCRRVSSLQVTVPETSRSITLFASVILRCDYSTSANPQDVVVTWRYKSFCKDPILDYYSTSYQAALSLGQDPSNDCQDSQRTVRIVIQKKGTNEPILGSEYTQRKITIQNQANLVISEVMWWDNGVYICTVDAPGDTTGDPDKDVKLIVYVFINPPMLVVIGLRSNLIIISLCYCSRSPVACNCSVNCNAGWSCCSSSSACPEKAVMRYRMVKDAQKAMSQWGYGQPVYAPLGSNTSSNLQPLLYTDYGQKQNIPLNAMPPPLPQPLHPVGGPNPVLDYIENQVRGMERGTPIMPLQQQPQPPPQFMPQPMVYMQGPPSMLSSLNEQGVRELDRRVIQLPPPLVGRMSSSDSSRRTPLGPGSRGRYSGRSSGSSAAAGRGQFRPGASRKPWRRRDDSPPRRGASRSYSDESDLDERRRPGGGSRHRGSGLRTRSRDDLMEPPRRPLRRERSHSPPARRGSWSSEDGGSRRGARSRGKGAGLWPEKPPSYTSIEFQPGRTRNGGPPNNDRFSERSSRSGRSVVI